jgi:outer membrane protein assembly factor BamB
MDLRNGRLIFTFWAPGAANAGIRAMQLTEGAHPALRPLWANDSLPGGSASSPALSGDGSRVYVTDNDGSLHALNAATGEEIWNFAIGYNAAGGPSLSPSGTIIPAGAFLAPTEAIFDRGDSAELAWRNNGWLNEGIATQAAGEVAYVTINFLGLGNYLIVADAVTGAELDRELLAIDSVFTVGTTLGPDGTVYVPSVDGWLFAFRSAN